MHKKNSSPTVYVPNFFFLRNPLNNQNKLSLVLREITLLAQINVIKFIETIKGSKVLIQPKHCFKIHQHIYFMPAYDKYKTKTNLSIVSFLFIHISAQGINT